jgi:hypothetical protein
MKKIILLCLLVSTISVFPQQKKFLFDATKAETAGNADWIISASGGSVPRFPTPAQANVTQSTPETYWTGALSAWGIDLVKLGHHVESLPPGTAISFGNNSNPQDLSNYDVFIVDEPNTVFSSAEKTAILSFVQNGGGLFMISDHNGSDRNNDGWDSPKIWNDMMSNNSVQTNPFGISIDLLTFNDASTNVLPASTNDPVIKGPAGTVTNIKISAGTTFTLNPTINNSVKGVIWKTGASQGNSSVLCGYVKFGSGRVVFVGDSSPADDGTGQSGNSLYPGWTGEANGDHRRLHLNGSLWLAKVTGITSANEQESQISEFELNQNYPNPFNPSTTIEYSLPSSSNVSLKVFDILGNEVADLVNGLQNSGKHSIEFNASNLPSGLYIYRVQAGDFLSNKKMVLLK